MSRTKKIYFLAAFVMIIGCYALNKSYSLFVATEEQEIVTSKVPTLDSSLSIPTITLSSNEECLIKQTITNTSEVPINYALNTTGSNYTIKMTSDEGNKVLGTLEANQSNIVYLYVKNNSTSSNTITFNLNKKYTTLNNNLTSNISSTSLYTPVTSITMPYSDETNTLKYKILYNFINSSIYTGNKPTTTNTTAATEFNKTMKYTSNNKGKSSSTATTTFTFTTTSAGKLNFDYFVSSESASYDYLTITLQKDSNTAETILDKTGGENKSGSISKDLVSGSTYKLTLNYRKDGSVDKYDDLAYIKNLEITASLNSSGITTTDGTYKFVGATDDKITLPITSGSVTFQSPTSFTAIETSEVGLYQAEDDYGTTYYFRGASTKNYVNYAGMCWRIVRIQGDGSVKLILASEKTCSTSNLTTSSGFATNGAAGTVGTTLTAHYGYKTRAISNRIYQINDYINSAADTTGNARTKLNSWLTTKITSESDLSLLKDDTWCIGDQTNGYSYDDTGEIVGTVSDLINSKTNFYFTAGNKYKVTKKQSFKCETTGTDGETDTNKVGMLTYDEIVYAGGGSSANSTYYLNNNATARNWWALSPSLSLNSSSNTYGTFSVIELYGDGRIFNCGGTDTISLRPVVSLVSTTTVSSGEGTISSPYVVG